MRVDLELIRRNSTLDKCLFRRRLVYVDFVELNFLGVILAKQIKLFFNLVAEVKDIGFCWSTKNTTNFLMNVCVVLRLSWKSFDILVRAWRKCLLDAEIYSNNFFSLCIFFNKVLLPHFIYIFSFSLRLTFILYYYIFFCRCLFKNAFLCNVNASPTNPHIIKESAYFIHSN